MSGRLFVCSTPIGNLEDVTHRLLRVLAEVDLIAAEDTRRTRKLLTRYGIKARLVSYHEGNERTQSARLIARLGNGEKIALVTDSGTPTISDPGYQLVKAAIDRDFPIEIVPGPSAVVAALAVSGLPTDRFVFEGFLPRKAGDRTSRLEELARDPRTVVVFEAPGRVVQTLTEIQSTLGDRRIAAARELTKAHEEVLRGRVSEVLDLIGEGRVLGEVVLVIEGAEESGDFEAAVRQARLLAAGGKIPSRAAAEAARKFGVARGDVYRALANYSGEKGSQG